MDSTTGELYRRRLSTVSDILSYDESAVDMGLNYAALLVTFVTVYLMLQVIPVPKYHLYFRHVWFPLTVGLFAFQVVVCIFAHCVGISIVWSAYVGFNGMLYHFLHHKHMLLMPVKAAVMLVISSVYSFMVWMYYAVYDDWKSTLAHACAVLLGIAISVVMDHFMRPRVPADAYSGNDSEVAAVVDGPLRYSIKIAPIHSDNDLNNQAAGMNSTSDCKKGGGKIA